MKHVRLYPSCLLVGLVSLLAVPLVVAADDAAAPAVAAPPLAYGVSEIIQLSQAQVSDPTIVTFIKNSGNSYGLDAPQVLYLRQQGVSETVINAMLSQPAPGTLPAVATAASAVPENTVVPASPASVNVVQAPPPTVSAPASSVYVIPDTATYRYYSTYNPYGGYPGYFPVMVSVGYVGHSGGGYHSGGNHGGGFRNGSHH